MRNRRRRDSRSSVSFPRSASASRLVRLLDTNRLVNIALCALPLLFLIYLGAGVRLLLSQPLLDSNGNFSGGLYRGLGYNLPRSTPKFARIGLSAAVSIPTSLLCATVKRVHALRARRSGSVNLEIPTWSAHVSWRSPINYATSCIIVLIMAVTNASAATVVTRSLEWETVRTMGSPNTRSVDTFIGYSPFAMVIHATGMIILSLWAGLFAQNWAKERKTISQQLGEITPLGYQDLRVILYHPESRKDSVLRRRKSSHLKLAYFCSGLLYTLCFAMQFVQRGIKFSLQDTTSGAGLKKSDVARLELRDSATAPLRSFALILGALSILSLILEVFWQSLETCVTRAWWESMWAKRSSGDIHGDIIVEGLRSLSIRPHFIWLPLFQALESWIISNAFIVADHHRFGTNIEYQIGLFPISGWCLVAQILWTFHYTVVATSIKLHKFSKDGLQTHGSRREWVDSGIIGTARGSKWGALVLPEGENPGQLGFGDYVTIPPPKGDYIYGKGK